MMSVAALKTDQVEQEVLSQQQCDTPDSVRQFEAAIRLACFLVRPYEFLSDEHCQSASFEGVDLKALAQYPGFRGPLNRHLSASLLNDAEIISQEMISRLAMSPELRLGTVILTSSLEETRNVSLMLASGLLSRRVRSLMLKRDRTAIQETLGLVGFDIAIQEAPLLYPLLSNIDMTPAEYPLFQPDIPLDERQTHAIDLGFQLIGRFLDAIEPVFAEMYAKRLPGESGYAERENFIASLDDVHCKQFLRMIRRRQKTWSDIIG